MPRKSYIFAFIASLIVLMVAILILGKSPQPVPVAEIPPEVATSTAPPNSFTVDKSGSQVNFYVESTGFPFPPSGSGSVNPNVTQANIATTICKSGWTATIRPPTSYTNKLKAQDIAAIGRSPTPANMKIYELDHVIPLEIGGNPTDPKNLRLEEWNLQLDGDELGAHSKDKIENYLHREVCAGRMTLADAQAQIFDWVALYKKLYGSK